MIQTNNNGNDLRLRNCSPGDHSALLTGSKIYQMDDSLSNGIHGIVFELTTNVPLCGTAIGSSQC
jgi:hypothetical protein